MSHQVEPLEVRFSAMHAKLLKSSDNLGALDMRSQVLKVSHEYNKGILIFYVDFIVKAFDRTDTLIWQGGGKIVICFRPKKGTKITEEGAKAFAPQLDSLLPEQIDRFKTLAMIFLSPDGADVALLG